MRTELALGQADALDQRLQRVEAQGGEAETLAHDFHHAVVLGRAGRGILIKVLVLIALQLLDDAARYQLQRTLGSGEADEGAGIDERRTGDADVHLLGAVLVEHLHVVAKLRAAHDGVVAEKQTLALKHGAVGDELHLGHEAAHLLTAGGKATGPGGSVFGNGAVIRDTLAFGIAQGHAHARVGDAAGAIHFGRISLTHFHSTGETHFLDVAAFVAGRGTPSARRRTISPGPR